MAAIALGFCAVSARQAWEAVVLLSSLRAFGGALAQLPAWAFVPQGVALGPAVSEALGALEGTLVPFAITDEQRRFPFAAKALAAGAAETRAAEAAHTLIWTDAGSLVIREPVDLMLEPGRTLACRPVDHVNVGSPADGPLDAFWREVYRDCGVGGDASYSIVTSVDERRIRPYYNAGMLVVRPERGLLRAWRDRFIALHRRPHFERAYDQHRLHRIFVHQAVLAGVVLATLDPAEIQELPHLINYPLHMHADYPRSRRPACLNEVVTCRYESVFEDARWRDVIAVEEPLATWLDGQVVLLSRS